MATILSQTAAQIERAEAEFTHYLDYVELDELTSDMRSKVCPFYNLHRHAGSLSRSRIEAEIGAVSA